MSVAETLAQAWQQQLQQDLPQQSAETQNAIAQWLLGETPERLNQLSRTDLGIAKQAIHYRYRIFHQTYWGLPPERAYQKLLQKLGGLFLIRSKVKTWISLSRDRQRTVKEVLQEVIQEMLQSDRHLQQQLQWIAQCTPRPQLRSLLTLATLEEYCLRPIRNQPLLVYRFVNYLRRSQRGGMTQVPSQELIQLISEEIGTDVTEGTLSLLDFEATAAYENQQAAEEEQHLRDQVKQSFMGYLSETLDETAARWLELHLQGYTQEVIAKQLNVSIKQVYRLREKISYHAIRIFALKEQPELVFSWLKTSLSEHNLGLTPKLWQTYWQTLSESQQQILTNLKAGQSFETIARTLNLKPKQLMGEWSKLYLAAQELRLTSDEKNTE